MRISIPLNTHSQIVSWPAELRKPSHNVTVDREPDAVPDEGGDSRRVRLEHLGDPPAIALAGEMHVAYPREGADAPRTAADERRGVGLADVEHEQPGPLPHRETARAKVHHDVGPAAQEAPDDYWEVGLRQGRFEPGWLLTRRRAS